ncbi:MAG: glycoside hydrolase N-terminal domain-containing protein [Alistipes sp.]|nr:glycoside hydrolase N-terminal domain-containing protein [Alistipes sp.]
MQHLHTTIRRATYILAFATILFANKYHLAAQNTTQAHSTNKEYCVIGSTSFQPSERLTLWYTQPATTAQVRDQWMEYSLPIGNGEFGASIFGGVKVDEIQFNEKSLWSGTQFDNKGYDDYGHYENFGSIYVENLSPEFAFDKQKAVCDYHRELDITTATARVGYTTADSKAEYQREYIASNPDRVIAARYTASGDGKLSLRITMASGVAGDKGKTQYVGNEATFSGKLQTVSYNARLRVVAKGGTTECDGKSIIVRQADECLLILGGGTDFDAYAENFTSETDKLPITIAKRVNAAAKKGWDALYSAHVKDYKQFFNRTTFSLNSSNTMPTDELIRNYAKRITGSEPEVLMLEELYFAYGRYLAISSSRGVDLPSNLQGIWNNKSKPAWNCDIHANINVQMNYWPVESTNLSELHVPFLNYITNMATNHSAWKRYAKDSGQERGWTCYTENNIFGGVGGFMHEYVIANAWYCTHLWQHYRYTLDKKFLEKAFPAMLSATQYWLDRMILDPKDGTYVCPKEYSPEHGPVEDGMPHAQQLVWELFDNTLKAVDILSVKRCGIDPKELELIRDRFQKMDRGLAIETYDGAWGESVGGIKVGDKLLREWKYSPYKVGQRYHRHISHAMCLYPFNQINSESEYFEPMVNTLRMRGDASTGWSMGWKINLWARALDGDHAHDILELALRHHSVAGGGVYYNLYDSHAPFQIDGNFGATAGIAEMLLQSHSDCLHILPALPEVWSEGEIKGLKAIGDFTVGIKWAKGKASRIEIVNNQGSECVVRYPSIDKARISVNGKPVRPEALDSSRWKITSRKGSKIVIEF